MSLPDIPVTSQYQKCQLSVAEAAWATDTTRTIALGSISMDPAVKKGSQKFAPRGILLPAVVSYGEEAIDIKFDGKATYEEIGYFISDVVSDAAAASVPSRSVECGGLKVFGAVVGSWNLKHTTKETTMDGTMFGKTWSVAAPTGSLTPAALTPLLNSQVTVAIGSLTVLDAFEWNLSVSGLWNPAYFVGSALPGGAIQKALEASFNIKFEASSANKALISDTATKAVTITFTGTGSKTVTITFDAKLEEPEPFSDQDGVYAYGLKYAILNKATKAISVTVVTS